ncbi:MAG: phasin family protein [Myxococcales bacterium]
MKTNDKNNALPFNVPAIDLESVFAAQQKNVETIVEVNRITVDGLLTIAKRQEEILKATMEDIKAAAQSKTPDFAGFAQNMLTKSVEHAKEIAQLVAKTNQDAFAVVSKRANETVAEVEKTVKVKA